MNYLKVFKLNLERQTNERSAHSDLWKFHRKLFEICYSGNFSKHAEILELLQYLSNGH